MARMTRRRVLGGGLMGLSSLAAPNLASAAKDEVDVNIVLAADVSRSVEPDEFQLQRQGYAEAFRDPRVIKAIRGGGLGRIGVQLFEWSSEWAQQIIADWAIIGDDESAAIFADRLERQPRPFADRTSIGVAMQYAMVQLRRSPFESRRQVIDVSGDGTNTNGIAPSIVRDELVQRGVVINALVILSPEPMPFNAWHTHPPGGLENYFRENVIGGPGAFTIVAEDFTSFALSIANKLIREIA